MARDGGDSKTSSPEVSVILVAYEPGPTLAACLEALRAQTFGDFEIVLVDNGCSGGEAMAASQADPSIVYIDAGANLGFAAGVNLGARTARGRWLALLNPDAYADPAWLEELVKATKAWPSVHAFASRQLMAEDPGRLDGLGDVMSIVGFPFRGGYRLPDPGDTEVGEVFSACGGAMLVDRALFLDMGGFDERFFCYCEDVDLGYRLRLRGEPTLVIPAAVVRHEGSASTGGPRSDFATFHGTRNRFWVFVKDTPPLLFWLTLPLHLVTTATLFAVHAKHGELASPWKGLMAGFKGIRTALEARREAQKDRKVGSWGIARAMTWSPRDILYRRIFIQKWPPNRPGDA